MDDDPIQHESVDEPVEPATAGAEPARRPSAFRPRIASTPGYLATAVATAAALFFLLWWMLQNSGDEAPWIPAGLAASVVMLVAMAAREVVMRRALTRQILEQERRDYRVSDVRKRRTSGSNNHFSASFRNLQRRSDEADAPGSLPAAHLDVYKLCKHYLDNSEEALRSVRTGAQGLATLRAGQERVRVLQKHHLLNWAAGEARVLTADAQRRSNIADKIETATRALDVIDSALKVYPDEPELLASAGAVREYISSVKVAHWVELAERAAFKGQFRRAIDRYRDALFYLSREEMREEMRDEMAVRIAEEVDELRARLRSQRNVNRQRTEAEPGLQADKVE